MLPITWCLYLGLTIAHTSKLKQLFSMQFLACTDTMLIRASHVLLLLAGYHSQHIMAIFTHFQPDFFSQNMDDCHLQLT